MDEMVEPFADAGDIADVAVAVLSEDGHPVRIYELTGPRPALVPRGGRGDRGPPAADRYGSYP
jgi:uncharacterized protein YbjT (DUF2867 family)